MLSDRGRSWIECFNRVERKTSRKPDERLARAPGPPGGPVAGEDGGVDELAALAGLSANRSPEETIERILVAAREQLGMEVAFVSEFAGGE